MKQSQLALLYLLAADDTTRVYAESDGYGDDLKLRLAGEISFAHADLREMVERGWVEVSALGQVRVLNAGGVALVEASNACGAKIEAAQRAVSHVLGRVREDAGTRRALGLGTKSFELLTEAAAVLFGEPVERVREVFSRPFSPTK